MEIFCGRCLFRLHFCLIGNGLFDLPPFFIGYGNIYLMGGWAVADGQGISLSGNRLAG